MVGYQPAITHFQLTAEKKFNYTPFVIFVFLLTIRLKNGVMIIIFFTVVSFVPY